MIWGAVVATLVLGIAMGVVVHRWTLLLIPLVPFVGMVVVAVVGVGENGGQDWSHVLAVAFVSGTAPMALGIVAGIRLTPQRDA